MRIHLVNRGSLFLMAILVLVLAGQLTIAQDTNEAESLRLAGLAREQLETGELDLARLLAVRALREGFTQDAFDIYNRVLDYNQSQTPVFNDAFSIISPSGKLIATSNRNYTIVSDVDAGKAIYTFFGHFVSWSPDGSRLVSRNNLVSDQSSTPDNSLALRDSATGRIIYYVPPIITMPDTSAPLPEETPLFAQHAWSHNGTMIASWEPAFSTITIRDTTTGVFVQTLPLSEGVSNVTWSDDDTQIVLTTEENLNFLDVATGQLVQTQPNPAADSNVKRGEEIGGIVISAMTRVSPDNTKLAHLTLRAGETFSIEVVDIASERMLFNTSGLPELFRSRSGVIWSPTSDRLLAISQPKTDQDSSYYGPDTAMILDAQTGEVLHEISGYRIRSSWSPDGAYIATTDRDGSFLRIWNANTGQLVASGELLSPLRYLDWAPDNSSVVVTVHRRGTMIWDFDSKDAFKEVYRPEIVTFHNFFVHFGWSPDGERFAVSAGFEQRILDSHTLTPVQTLAPYLMPNPWDEQQPFIVSMIGGSWSPDGSKIAGITIFENVVIWDVNSNQIIQVIPNEDATRTPLRLRWSPDGRFLVLVWHPGWISIIDTNSEQIIQEFHYRVLEWSPDSSRLSLNDFTVLDPVDLEVIVELADPSFEASRAELLIWSPDGRNIATTPQLAIWDAATGSLVYHEPDMQPVGMAWSPDSTRLALVNQSGEFLVWDVAAREQQVVPLLSRFNLNPVRANLNPAKADIAWSPDGSRIVVADSGGTIVILDVATNHPIRLLRGVRQGYSRYQKDGLKWSPSGDQFYYNSALVSVPSHIQTAADYGCLFVPRDFTPEERQQFGIQDDTPTCPQSTGG